ncbi:hypothetical protein D9V37_19605 [Nocardioides mangrovicus]|uniref:Pyrrolo-quinoline quinone repeat domain-containing protein n=1 Tax=Nocardioides mangrovicus TaxID=2478913 RepID=A0A3L8P1G7_9ACTN|nr:PQQ-binding-like beta-propeller repeat protein [Nocardioides mangrovicus]RLV48258.1 hypothetical protein D9V37_19605 [Nocardioides mangrovicus]
MRLSRTFTVSATALALLAGSGAYAATPPSGGRAHPARTSLDWPTYHGNRARTGYSSRMPAVSGTPSVTRSTTLDGAVYASPVVGAGRTVVATENDTVYAFGRHGRLLWRRHLGTPTPSSALPCGDISPLGITGTPVYVASRRTVYLVAESGPEARHTLYALAIGTGHVRWHRSMDLPGVEQRAMQQRGALTVAHGRVWVPFGALAGDCGGYKGRVVGTNLDRRHGKVSYTPPTQRGGGMWTPPGPSVDSQGRLFVVTANGAAGPGDAYDFTNSVLRLTQRARLVDSFAPSIWPTNNTGDVGLGSQGATLVGPWIFVAGKSAPSYVLRASHLGGIGGQVSQAMVCNSYGGTAVAGTIVYVPCTDGLRAIAIDEAGQINVLWHAAANITGAPVVGGGRIWSLDPNGGTLYSLDPTTGATVSQTSVGRTSRFATPAISGRNLLVPTLTGLSVVGTS